MSDPEIILIVRDKEFEIRRQLTYLEWRHGVNPGSIVADEISDMMRELRGRQGAGKDFKPNAQEFDSPVPETDP